MFLKNLNPVRRIRELLEELGRTRRERDQARKQVEQLEDEKQRLHEKLERLREENERLRNELEAALRAAKRQAAPFSRGKPKSNPQRPGRKSGKAHGTHHQRPVPDHVDEEIQVNAPAQCPDCGGPLTVERVESQYQEEIVRRTWVRRFQIPICRCDQCQKRVQGRHPLQTSDAIGAAAVQVGPEAVTLGVLMNKAQGLPHADAAAILKQGFGLTMSPSGICRAIQRVARKAEATWHALRDAARRSTLAHMDETGGRLEAELDRMLAPTQRDAANQRLANHLRHERPYLFTFLYCPGLVDATNNVAERVMRILVMIRKNWGGNRTENGARAQAVLTSVLCTARQQDKDAFQLLVDLLRSRQPKLLDLLPAVAESAPAAKARPRESSVLPKTPFPAYADIPLLPGLRSSAENPSFFNSA